MSSDSVPGFKYSFIHIFQRQRGFTNLTGVDYVQRAIDLAKGVMEKNDFTDIRLQVKISKFTFISLTLQTFHLHCLYQNSASIFFSRPYMVYGESIGFSLCVCLSICLCVCVSSDSCSIIDLPC